MINVSMPGGRRQGTHGIDKPAAAWFPVAASNSSRSRRCRPCWTIQNLQTYFFTPAGLVKAINGIDLHIGVGETLALVGESGCGKSMTALSLLRLVPEPGRIVGGEIRL